MALFKKKKLELPKPIPPKKPDFEKTELKLPKFPEPDFSESFPTYKPIIPKHDIEKPMMPKYDIEHIKEAVKPKVELIKDEFEESPLILTKEEKPIPSPAYKQYPSLEESPLFVKIETYEDAIKDIELIKDNINKINEVLSNLDTIKKQEDSEIESWKQRVSKVKEKIMSIEKNLFEKR